MSVNSVEQFAESQTVSFKRLMQAFRMVDDITGKVGFDSGLDFVDISQDRLDAAGGQGIVCARTHAASKQNLAIGDRVHHCTVTMLGSRVISMAFTRLVSVHFLFSELVVIGFGTIFLGDDLTVFNSKYLIMLGATKMGGYGFEIISNDGDFHGSLFFMWFLRYAFESGHMAWKTITNGWNV
jgi:hypothetical protein